MADGSEIDNAVVALLRADVVLTGLVPDGVYMDEAAPDLERFVIVSIVDTADEDVFEGRAFEDVLYRVKAVMRSTSGGNIQSAAARIDLLLDRTALTIPGHTHMATVREGRVRTTEPDGVDPEIRWQHRGGYYRVQASI
jgi:hypothetical protein